MSDTPEDRPLETLVEKEREMGQRSLNGSGNRVPSSDDSSPLTAQMDELKEVVSGLAKALASQASTTKDAASSTVDQFASVTKAAVSNSAEAVQNAGKSAMDVATDTAKTVTETKRKAQREIPGFETMQTLATLAPIAATVARRVPGGRKMVIAGSVAYGAYLLLDALGRKENEGDAA